MDLFAAAEAGDLERVQILVERGEDMEKTDSWGRTPLHAASANGHLAVVRFLFEQHAAKRKGRILPTLACSFIWVYFQFILFVLHLIMTAWSKLSQHFPTYTATVGNLKCSQLLVGKIRRNLAVVMARTIYIKNYNTMAGTPINVAARNGHLAVVRYLGEQQPSQLDLADTNGLTPLINAATNGHLDVVRYLNEQGANREATDVFGMTPLNRASCDGHLEVVRYLVEQAANIDKADSGGNTPLIVATCNDNVEVVRYLLEQGADRDKADSLNGWTSLHFAAHGGHLEITKLLMVYGADLNARNNYDRLPIDEADWNDEFHIGNARIDLARTEEIKQAIRDEPRRRMDHGHKRATEQDRHPNAATSALAQQEEYEEEEGKLAEEDEDSEPSSDEDDN